MKILITGGQGYIARNLKPLFEEAGYEVLAPSRTELDLLNFEMLDRYFQQNSVDAIIHTAARGGRRTKKDTYDDVLAPNLKMFENLLDLTWFTFIPTFILGSGAEFDRRDRIINASEDAIFRSWPLDPYGLSKNLIARRAIVDTEKMFVLRIFATFNYDEDTTRFIKSGILNVKRGLSIEVHQNRYMDFFYLDDIFNVIHYLLHHSGPRNINLVYPEKQSLIDIANKIHKHMGVFGHTIKLNENGEAYSFTGSGSILKQLPVKLIGFDEGLRRTVLKLV